MSLETDEIKALAKSFLLTHLRIQSRITPANKRWWHKIQKILLITWTIPTNEKIHEWTVKSIEKDVLIFTQKYNS